MKIRNYIFAAILSLISVTPIQSQCIEESHSPFQNQGWMSCQTSLSVIPERGDRHWIMYDLNNTYELMDLQIWNHNAWGETGNGVKSILIDYSTNLQDWKTIGPLDIDRATGSWKYVANEAFEFEEAIGQYVLITVLETWDPSSTCAGFGELRINVQKTTAAEDIASEEILDIYPNPTSVIINVQFEHASEIIELNIVNSIGQIIRKINPQNNDSIEIDVSELKAGLYHLSAKSKKGNSSKSFIKI